MVRCASATTLRPQLLLLINSPPRLDAACSNYILFALSVGTVSLIAERLKQQDTEGAGRRLSGSLFLAAMGGEGGWGGLGALLVRVLPC